MGLVKEKPMSNYYNNVYEIYNLMRDNKNNELYNKYPKVKIYRELLDLVLKACFEDEFGNMVYDYLDYYITGAFTSVFMSADKLYTEINFIKQDYQLFKKLVHLKTQQDDYLLLFFNPSVFNKHVYECVYYIYTLLNKTIDISDIEINNPKIKKFLNSIEMIRNNYQHLINDPITSSLLLYAYIYDNYDYLYRYLDNDIFYKERLVFHNYGNHDELTILSYNHNKIFRNIPKIFVKPNKIIK